MRYSLKLSNGYYIKTEIQTRIIASLFAENRPKTFYDWKDITHVYGAYPMGLNPRWGTKIGNFSGYFEPILPEKMRDDNSTPNKRTKFRYLSF